MSSYAGLEMGTEADRKLRSRKLSLITEQRNRCAHDEQAPEAMLRRDSFWIWMRIDRNAED